MHLTSLAGSGPSEHNVLSGFVVITYAKSSVHREFNPEQPPGP